LVAFKIVKTTFARIANCYGLKKMPRILTKTLIFNPLSAISRVFHSNRDSFLDRFLFYNFRMK